VGHYAPYLNYTLKVTNPDASPSKLNPTNVVSADPASIQTVLTLKQQLRQNSRKHRLTTNDVAYTFSQCVLTPTTNCVPSSPIFNVSVDPKMIPDHGTIDQLIFVHFLNEFLTTFSNDNSD
jgi:hypothetical protein